jgi:hypothetical protein
MPYDWRREQEAANRKRAADAEIRAKQDAWNKKLADDSKKSMDFWANKMQKEQEQANRGQSSKAPAGCASVLLIVAAAISAVSILCLLA